MKHYMPETMTELIRSLWELTPDSRIISGGTDLINAMNQGLCHPDALLYLGNIKGIRDISLTPDGIHIGAMVTMSDLAECSLLTGPYAALRHAGADVGSPQIREAATIGGNIANASPAGDLSPVLFLLQAQVVIADGSSSSQGESATRLLPIHKVLTGSGKTSLTCHEAIIGFVLPSEWPVSAKSAFYKLGYRRAVTISRIGLAILFDFDPDGRITLAEVIAGAIAPTPVHVEKAEQFLIGKQPDTKAAKEVGRFLSELILDITPEEFDRDYKVKAAFGIAEDVFHKIAAGAGT